MFDDADGQQLGAFVAAGAPMPAAEAALFAARVAELAAWQHAEGGSLIPLERTVRVVDVDGQARPVLAGAAQRPGPAGGAEDDDVRAIGRLLAALLDGTPVPGPVRSAIAACEAHDPAGPPTAAALAHHLRDASRDLLLGLMPSRPRTLGEAPTGAVPTPAGAGAGAVVGQGSADGRRTLRLTVAGIGVVAAIVVAVLALTGGGDGPPSPPTSTAQPDTEPATGPEAARACLDEACTAEARFEPEANAQPGGPAVVACDNAKDGLSAVAVFTSADRDGEASVWASQGTGTCAAATLDIAAGTAVTVVACTGDRPTRTIERCSDPVAGTA